MNPLGPSPRLRPAPPEPDASPMRFPSDPLCNRDCITKGEWERRFAITYGVGGDAASPVGVDAPSAPTAHEEATAPVRSGPVA